MAAFLEIREADGTTSASFLDLGTVAPGTKSAAHTLTVINTGDAATTDSRLSWGRVGAGDLTSWETISVGMVTYYSAAPVPLGPLAPGASVTFTLQASVPPTVISSTRPLASTITPQWLD